MTLIQPENKRKLQRYILIALAILVAIAIISGVSCSKTDIQPSQDSTSLRTIPLAMNTTWKRLMYVDGTDKIYNNQGKRDTLLRYAKKYKFTGMYFYDLHKISYTTANKNILGNFLQQASDSGITQRGATSGGSNSFVNGNIKNFNTSQTSLTKKFNRYNLELEWWNSASTFLNWMTNLTAIHSTGVNNDFYLGWLKNLGGVPDTIATKQQIQNSNQVFLHDYVNGVPTYNYANAPSVPGGIGRLDAFARGARQANTPVHMYIIISAEKRSFGAQNDFSGAVLQSYSTQSNPYETIEKLVMTDLNTKMTPLMKQWIIIDGFIWFDLKWMYAAIPPRFQ